MSNSTEIMLLSLLSAPSFTTYCDTGAVSKRTLAYLTDRSDVILRSQHSEKFKFSGGLSHTLLWELTVRAYIAPQTS